MRDMMATLAELPEGELDRLIEADEHPWRHPECWPRWIRAWIEWRLRR